MPSLRMVTWNSGGEADGRGAQLALSVNAINGTAPAVKLVAIQEARVGIVPPGSIYAQLTGGAAPFAGFVNPPDHPRELNPAAQPLAVGVNRSYLIGWDPTGGGPVSAGAAALISLAPAPGNGVEGYINGLAISAAAKNNLRQAARNIRAPVRKVMTITIGVVVHTIYFYTWHAELQANWLAANWATLGMLANPFAGPGMYPAFEFFQNSNQYTADLAALTPNDVLIVAGDFNITAADVNNNAALFPNFVGASSNLSHILAFSPNAMGANQAVLAQQAHYVTPYPPHAILTAEVQW